MAGGKNISKNGKKQKQKQEEEKSEFVVFKGKGSGGVVNDVAAKRLRVLLGMGFWVQGFRSYAWTGINFFLKDGLRVAPSTLQILQNSANLPMVGKPLYGVLSDAIYIRGEHRIPYLAIGALLQSVSWLAIALLPSMNISILYVTIFLLLGNLGASFAEVANDALVTEAGKPSVSKDNSGKSGSGELQSFVLMLASIGGVFGNLFGGISISRLSAQTMFLIFGLLLTLQFFTTIIVRERSLALPKAASSTTSVSDVWKQLLELSVALKKPEIFYSIAWFFMSYAMIPVLLGTMFFYQSQQLKLNSSVLGLSKVFGQVAMLVWSFCYNKWLKSVPPRKLIAGVQVATAVLMVSDAVFVSRVYWNMGIGDGFYVVVFSGLLEVLFQFKVLPFMVLMAELCPLGCEGSLMAFLMSAVALATIISGYLGVALASYVGVSVNNFSSLPQAILVQAACTLLPLLWSSWIPHGRSIALTSGDLKKEN